MELSQEESICSNDRLTERLERRFNDVVKQTETLRRCVCLCGKVSLLQSKRQHKVKVVMPAAADAAANRCAVGYGPKW